MLLLNSIGGGWYFTLGTLFHRAVDVGYQFYDRNYFDFSISYIPAGRPLAGIKCNISFFKCFLEFNIYDTRYHMETEKLFAEDIDITEEIKKSEPQLFSGDYNAEAEEEIEEITEVEEILPSYDISLHSDTPVLMQSVIETNQRVAAIPPINKEVMSKAGNIDASFLAEIEFKEHHNIALRQWVGKEDGSDSPLGEDVRLRDGLTVLLRSKDGGFHWLELHCDDDGWFVNHPFKIQIVDVVFDPKRKLWVVEEMI